MFAIRSEDDLNRALAEIDALMDVEHPSDIERDRLEVLTTLVEAFEDKRHPIAPPNAIEAIRFRLDQLGFHTPAAQAKTLAGLLGSRSRAYEILHRKRGLSAQMVTKIWRRLEIPLESLVRGMTVRNRSTPRNRGRAKRPDHRVPKRTGSS